ncbi:hypothetical protein LTR53_010184 [Teratosphaeriaceae sp. CCFEE 6253]|nr:hypothetical protein LTR53_010184 [Teratosphaeriaceae sp. CCFEE 6253]
MASPNILVSGSGIAGSVFAFWMLRAYPNANITIVERAPSLRLTGGNVDIRSSAVDIMQWMGAEEEIRRNCTGEAGVQLVRSDGSPIATLGASGRTDVQSVTSEFEIFRGALASIFMNPVKAQVQLIFDESVDTFDQHEDRVDVTFKNGKLPQSYDLLVAADGFSSRIRGKITNADPRDHIRDEGLHVCYFTLQKDLLNGSNFARWHNDTGGRVQFVRPDPHPDGRVRAHLLVVSDATMVERKRRLDQALREGNASYTKLMEELYADAGWLSKEILQGMRDADDLYCSIFAIVRSPVLHAGRVVLLGDAGYATPGIGTSLAIIGGYVLAGELLRHDMDVPAALRDYEGLMQPFVKSQDGNAATDVAMQWLNPQTQWRLSVRNAVFWAVGMFRVDRAAMAAAAWMGWSEKKLDMPAYPWPTA